jgi:hypothetical protein
VIEQVLYRISIDYVRAGAAATAAIAAMQDDAVVAMREGDVRT